MPVSEGIRHVTILWPPLAELEASVRHLYWSIFSFHLLYSASLKMRFFEKKACTLNWSLVGVILGEFLLRNDEMSCSFCDEMMMLDDLIN